MSELIDRVFDVAAIAKEKKQAEDIVNSFAEDILAIKDLINKNLIDIRAAKSVDELSNSAKKLNDSIIDGEKAVKAHQTELDKLKAKTEQLTGAEKAANIEIAKARLELAAAQKEVKAAAVAEIEAAAATGKLGDSYSELQADLKKADAAYKAMTKAERESSQGQQLLKKIADTREELTELDKGMKVYNRNVGNYEEAINNAAKSQVDITGGMDMMTKGAASSAKGMWGMVKSALAFIATPLGAVLAAIAGTIAVLVKAFSRSEESMGKLKQVTGALSGVFGGFMNALKPVVSFIADSALKTFENLGNIAEKASGLVSKGLKALGFDKAAASVDKMTASVKENAKAGQDLAKLQAQQTVNERELNRIRFEYLKEQEKFRQIRDDVSKSTTERIKANDALGASLTKQAKVEREILDQALYIANERVKIDGATSENLDKVAEAKANIADLEERINGFQSEQLVNAVGIRKEADDLAKAQNQLIIDAQRRLSDAKINAMQEGEAKALALSDENFRRQLEDLKINGQLTDELKKNLEITHNTEIQKIKDDFAKQKKEKDAQDLDTLLANYEKNIKKQTDILSASYKQQESDLKKQYANGKISKQQYDEQLIALQSKAVKEANDITIVSLQKQLNESIVTDEKRAELSARLRDLQIDNENAVTDAAIKANESKIESDKAAFDKRVQIATDLTNAGMELFGAIGEYQAQQSEQRIAELDAQQANSDELYEAQNSNLEKAIMSDARREEAQKKIDTEKAKRDKEIADKKQKEEIRAAKWEKAQALTSAIINTALAAIKMFADAGPLGVVLAALSTAAGLASIATIASQPLPAYADGGVTGSGLALWGEVRPEVAVTPSGQIMYAENPTVQNFDAGTRIFKSVEEFEKNISMSNGQNKGFEFDYEKMSEVMPEVTVNLDPSGLWGIVNKQGERAIIINRRYKIGN